MATTAVGEPTDLVVRGARTHNLKNIDLTLPVGKLIIVTGVSGSGKSSLAFDTIYAEGQRRYVESLSAYARQFLERMEKPDVDRIDGISPAIAIRQKNSVRNPRSTVGTTTEIHDYMRLLFARVGRTYCRNCGKEVVRETAEVIARQLGALPPGTRLLLGFDLPVVETSVASDVPEVDELTEVQDSEASGGDPRASLPLDPRIRVAASTGNDAIAAALANLRKKGFARLLIDGRAVTIDDVDPATLRDRTLLQVVVDRLQIDGGSDPDALRQRLTDSIETAYLEGGGAAWAIQQSSVGQSSVERSAEPLPVVHLFSERFECRACGIPYEDPQPRLFSFNNPFGACPTCHGFGNIIELDMDLVVPDRTKSIQQGAIEPWSKPHYRTQLAELKRAARKAKLRLDVPWSELTEDEVRFVVEGAAAGPAGSEASRGESKGDDYEGVRGFFRWLERKKYKVHVRVFLSRYRGYLTCPDCGGARLRREARDVHVGGRTIDRVAALTVREAQGFFGTLQLTEKEEAIAEKVLKEIRRRLSFLSDVGLDYLTLDRLSSTLSGGEAQRINLATSLGSALVGTLYVLDEPSIGLHSRDNLRLIAILRQLRDQGNTVLVVEHDADMIKVADHIVDLGLGAGEQGGRVVFSGTLDGLMQEPRSLTSKYLRRELAIPGARHQAPRQRSEDQAHGRDRAQPQGRRRQHPAERVDVRHRRQRLGQIDARARRALRGYQAREGRMGQAGRDVPHARRLRVHHRRSAGRSGADRPHAALESGYLPQGVRSDPRALRRVQGRAIARPDVEPLLLQRAGRPLRSLSGRRRSAGRDAVSRGRVRALRPVRRQAVQAASAGGALPRTIDPSGARPHRSRGAHLLQQLAKGAAAAAGARRDRPRLPPSGTTGHDAVRWRGSADQDRGAPVVSRR